MSRENGQEEMMEKQAMWLVGAAAVGVVASSASASITMFMDRASWEAAVGGAPIVNEDLNGVSPFVFADGQTLDTGVLQIRRDGSPNAADGALEIEPGANFGNIDGTTFLSGETGVTPHERVDIGFSGNAVFAFGADFTSPFSGDGIGVQVGSDVFLLDFIPGFSTGFFGFVSSSATFSSVAIVGNGDSDAVFQELWSADNFAYAIPSPGAVGLLGLAGVAAVRRRR